MHVAAFKYQFPTISDVNLNLKVAITSILIRIELVHHKETIILAIYIKLKKHI